MLVRPDCVERPHAQAHPVVKLVPNRGVNEVAGGDACRRPIRELRPGLEEKLAQGFGVFETRRHDGLAPTDRSFDPPGFADLFQGAGHDESVQQTMCLMVPAMYADEQVQLMAVSTGKQVNGVPRRLGGELRVKVFQRGSPPIIR